MYGDIVNGLMGLKPQTCDALFCSHVLEHLSLQDLRVALKNSYELLKKGGIFRCIVPDLEAYSKKYLEKLKAGENDANHYFLERLRLHTENRGISLKQLIVQIWGNAGHKYMWDASSLEKELSDVGFTSIRQCLFNDSKLDAFKSVEVSARFENAIAFESIK
jgi:SAM-dependent methyltransferase